MARVNMELISKEIDSFEDAKAFIDHLVETDNAIHLEDDANDIICMATGQPTFTPTEAVHINKRLEDVYRVWDYNGDPNNCPIAYLMEKGDL